MKFLLKKPSAWIPFSLSALNLILLVSHILLFGIVHEQDEGAAAHIFQILLVLDVFAIGFFAATWLPKNTKSALQVLGIQILAMLIPLAIVFCLEL